MSTITSTSGSGGGLPKLTPKSTPVFCTVPTVNAPKVCTPPKLVTHSGAVQPRTLQNINIPSVYNVYPQKPITSVDVSDFDGMSNRTNPLRPDGFRRTCMLETTDKNFQNEKRSQIMQRMTRMRYHTAYEKYPYGSPAEKEIYRRLFREGLKEQMVEHERRSKETFQSKVVESQEAQVKDRDDLRRESDKYCNHYQVMTTYRDANKELMEQQWQRSRRELSDGQRYELELLRYNPINWSGTLK